MASRLNTIAGHLNSTSTYNTGKVQPKHDDDIVICSYARTAMTRARRGPQKDTPCEAMLAPVLKDVLAKANNFDPKLVQEICIGNVNQPGAGSTTSRMAQFLGEIPDTTPLYGINRLCSSGLQAIIDVANSIRAGQIDCGIGGGVESMSMYDMQKSIDPEKLSD